MFTRIGTRCPPVPASRPQGRERLGQVGAHGGDTAATSLPSRSPWSTRNTVGRLLRWRTHWTVPESAIGCCGRFITVVGPAVTRFHASTVHGRFTHPARPALRTTAAGRQRACPLSPTRPRRRLPRQRFRPGVRAARPALVCRQAGGDGNSPAMSCRWETPGIVLAKYVVPAADSASSATTLRRARACGSGRINAVCARGQSSTHAPIGCRSAVYESSGPSGAQARTTAASFQPRFISSPMPRVSLRPPNGEWTCVASPARRTRPAR